MKKYLTRSTLIALVIGAVLGFILLAAVRLVTYSPERTHYHANFAVYINGERQQFKGPQYYEDVAVCSAYKDMTPKKRTHMHNNINDTVHVHDNAVTWGDFFQNLGWVVDNDFIKTDTQLYTENDTQKVSFMLNGQDQPSISNTVIGDEDRLLISYGSEKSSGLDKQYDSIAKTAHEHDETQDPASCSGDEQISVKDRLKHIFDTK
jgi:hypothetical protein